MPIVINEVVISVTVTDAESSSSNSNTSASKEEIIKECVELIMAMINDKNER